MTIEEKVAEEILERSKTAKEKYGATMERTDLTRLEWLQHAKEEAMDLAVYLQKLIDMEGAPAPFDEPIKGYEVIDGDIKSIQLDKSNTSDDSINFTYTLVED